VAIEGDRSIWAADPFGTELLELTVGDLLDQQAARFADREALVCVDPEFGLDVRWSYAVLQSRVDHLARALIGLGLVAGDRVAVLAPNLPEWILLEYALAKIGAVLVTVNTAFRQHELGYLLRQGRVRALVTVAEFRGNPYLQSVHALQREAALPDLEHIVLIGKAATGALPFAELLRLGEAVPQEVLRARQEAVKPGDVVQIQYTSGTTGAPKGVMLTHRGTVNNANLMGLRAGWTEHDRLLAVMPLFHTAGCVCNALGMLARGGTLLALVVFDATKALAMITAERATIMNGVPTMYLRLLAEPGVREGAYAGSSLRIAFMGGTAIPPVVLQDMKTAFGADPMVIMGMTEASPLITQTLPADSFDLCSTTAGIPLPFTAIKVIDPVTGEVLPTGQAGELCIRGYGVTLGYFDMPERTAEAIDPAGWLHSGDLATLDARGYLRIVGRAKDMIIRGGENIYPAEIEHLLMQHPMLEQVQVVGVPDPEFGEEAYAFIVLRDGAALTVPALREHCRASFSRHKVPRYMEFVEALPQTASGKIKKFELREAARRKIAGA
jgi:fatty-acyl-CoA synthase